jgi:DNA-binding protein HU-beta
MNKSELIEAIAESSDVTKAAAGRILDSLIKVVTDTLKHGDSVVLPGFLSIATGVRAARTGRNPKTGEVLNIKAARVVKVKIGKTLKDTIADSK